MNEMTTTNNTNTNMTRFSLPDSLLDSVAKQLCGPGNYGSVEKTGGFKVSGVEKAIPEIRGVVTDMQIYQARWEASVMLKLDYTGGEPVHGYQLRGDMTILVNPDFELQLSLSPTSLKGAVSYLKSLQNQGISPNQVLTTFRTKAVSGKFGSYSICTFEASQLPTHAAQPEMKNITPPAFTAPAPAAEPAPDTTSLPAGWN